MVIITGYYGFDNLGDEAILEELVAELRSHCAKEEIIVLSNNPEHTASIYGIKSINRWDWVAYFKLLTKARLLISGGGGLFQDKTGLGSAFFYGLQIFAARLMGVKIFIYAQGVGPLQKFITKQITRFAFSQANIITLRDTQSLSLVQKWNLKAELTADPVWGLSSSPLPSAIQNTITSLRSNNNALIALSLRNDPALTDEHLEHLAQVITNNLPENINILLLPLQINQDKEFLLQIQNYFKKLNRKTYLLEGELLEKPSTWLSLMENIDLLIGMRLHALIMAIKAVKPVVGIAYDPKVTYLLNEFSQPNLSLQATPDGVWKTEWSKTIIDAIKNREKYTQLIESKLSKVKQLAKKNALLIENEVATTGNAVN